MVQAHWQKAKERFHFHEHHEYPLVIYDVTTGKCKNSPQHEQWAVLFKVQYGPGTGKVIRDLWNFTPKAMQYVSRKIVAMKMDLKDMDKLQPEELLGKEVFANVRTNEKGWPELVRILRPQEDRK